MFKRILTYSILTLIALGGFFGNIVTQKDSNTNSVISMSYETSATYAADPCPPTWKDAAGKPCPVTPTEAAKMYNTAIDTLNILLWIITVVVSPAILFAGWLMSPDWTSGDLFGLRTPMYALWVTVSNIVYFIYAILLILIALGTMFGQDKFSYKVMLPKLALGILMVPFTWWFVQWTISIATVVTASVITIPAETMKWDAAKNGAGWTKESIPTLIVISETGTGWYKNDSVTEYISPETYLTKSSGMYGYMMVYAYSIFKFDQVKQLNGISDILKEWVWIVHQWIIAAIMFIIFGLLTMALIAMLLVRAIKLWVYAIFSPLFTFRFVAGWNLMWGADESFTIKEFIGLAFVPAIVWLTLSFGLILINAVSSGKMDTAPGTPPCTEPLIKNTGCVLWSIMGSKENSITRKIANPDTPEATTINSITMGWITVEFKWKAGAAQPAKEAASASSAMSVLDSAGGIFGTLIIDIIALVFIWMAFMAAKNVSKAVSMAVEPFEKIGKQVWGLAQSIPKYTPIPGLGMSMSGLEKGIGKVEQWFKDNRANKDAASPLGKLMHLDAAARQETVKAIENIRASSASTMTPEMVGNLRTQLSQESGWNKPEKTAEALNTILEKYAKKDASGKVVDWTNKNELMHNMGAMWIKDITDLQKLQAMYEKWTLTKDYLQNNNAGQKIYKTIFINEWVVASDKQTPPATPTTIEINLWWNKLDISEVDQSKAENIISKLKPHISTTSTSKKADDIATIIQALKKGKISDSIIDEVKIGLGK
jgi:hypothetical protein